MESLFPTMIPALSAILIGVQVVQSLFTVRDSFTDKAKGFHLPNEGPWIALGIAWVVYGSLVGSVTIALAGGMNAAVCCVSYARGVRSGAYGARRGAVLFLLFLAVVSVSGLSYGVVGLSVGLSVLSVIQFIPQIARSGKDVVSGGADSIPVLTSFLRVLYTGGWVLFSALIGDIVCLLWGIAGTIAFTLQIFSYAIYKSRNKVATTSVAGSDEAIIKSVQ